MFFWFAATLAGGPGVVVCRAGDGHSELEIAHVGCEDDAEPYGASIGEPVDACSDSALFDGAVRVEPDGQRVVLPPADVTCFPILAGGGDSASASRRSGAAPARPPSHLTALASTELRI